MANATTTIHPVVVARAQNNAHAWDAAPAIVREHALAMAMLVSDQPAPDARKRVRVALRTAGIEPKTARALAAHAVRATR